MGYDDLDTLRQIAASVGADVIIGEVPDGVTIVGRPPASATLCKDTRGRVYCDHLDSPRAIEEVLHELAHASGEWSEWRCYEREATWALRLSVDVAAAVYEAASQAWPDELRPRGTDRRAVG